MERSSTTPEGAELWETNDQGCDIMLRHLEAARGVAHNTHSYTKNAEKILQGENSAWISFLSFFSVFIPLFPFPLPGFQCDEELLEVFKTDFQLRLLWGSRGAAVNQSDRYNKFNLILTALSRKLEPPPKTQTVIWRPNAAEFSGGINGFRRFYKRCAKNVEVIETLTWGSLIEHKDRLVRLLLVERA